MKRTVAIFANSVKHGKHCVAGKDVLTREWIRPVANAAGAELAKAQCVYINPYGSYTVKPLQKIEMELAFPAPLINQPENHVVGNSGWVQRYKLKDEEVANWLDAPELLWGTGNRVPYQAITSGIIKIETSLHLVQVNNLRLAMEGKRRRAYFEYGGCNYDLPCTDPSFDEKLSSQIHQNVLCVSLGEPYDPSGGQNLSCYKIVATII